MNIEIWLRKDIPVYIQMYIYTNYTCKCYTFVELWLYLDGSGSLTIPLKWSNYNRDQLDQI